jgi:hypothetical protein
LIKIINADHLCMARAIAMSWAKLHTVTTEEWQTTEPKGCARQTTQGPGKGFLFVSGFG